jgi:Protein of unknown function with HXXEE motif
MELVLWLLLVAAVLHVVEEWVWPGGFLSWFRELVGFAEGLSMRLAVAVNAAFLALMAAAAIVADANPRFSLSAASLCFANGVLHVVGTVRTNRYSPGLVTGAVLYLPLAVAAYAAAADEIDAADWIASLGLGASYQAAAIGAMILRSRLARAS